jgi:hypothetical protein
MACVQGASLLGMFVGINLAAHFPDYPVASRAYSNSQGVAAEAPFARTSLPNPSNHMPFRNSGNQV